MAYLNIGKNGLTRNFSKKSSIRLATLLKFSTSTIKKMADNMDFKLVKIGTRNPWDGEVLWENDGRVYSRTIDQVPGGEEKFNEYLLEKLKTDPVTLLPLLSVPDLIVKLAPGGYQDLEHVQYNSVNLFPASTPNLLLQELLQDDKVDRAVGAMVGMAIGDSVGHPLEFLPVVDEPKSVASDGKQHFFELSTYSYENPKNAFALDKGQFTDDASMGLCIADSLIKYKSFRGDDIRIRFHNWWFHSYNNTFHGDRVSVGLGGNISRSLYEMKPAQQPTATFEAESEDAGNGSLMRLAPIPVYYHRDLNQARHFAALSSYTTHPGPLAACCCELLTFLIASAIQTPPNRDTPNFPKDWMEEHMERFMKTIEKPTDHERAWVEIKRLIASNEPDDSRERCWNWKAEQLDILGSLKRRGDQYNGYPVLPAYYGAFSMDGLALALHCVYHTKSFDEALVRVVNFLGDADSTGSIACQLAGALYGYASINEDLKKQLTVWDRNSIPLRAALLCVTTPQDGEYDN
eukprot:m.334334 g.334334  ORF g.334334 m.334334 type:complete len:518 (+) comp17336_c0_seq1:30-1583(+)